MIISVWTGMESCPTVKIRHDLMSGKDELTPENCNLELCSVGSEFATVLQGD